MENYKNQQIVLAKRPSGMIEKDCFRLEDIEMSEINAYEVLLESLYISVDAGMRGFMNKGKDDDRGNKFELDEPITSRSVAKVIQSNNKEFKEGEIVLQPIKMAKISGVQSRKPRESRSGSCPYFHGFEYSWSSGFSGLFRNSKDWKY